MYIPKFTLVGGRTRIWSVAVAAVNVIALLLVVGCGVTPTVAPGADLPPTPTPAATPPALSDVPDIGPDGRIGCSTTLAFVIGPWKVLRGIDQVPSGPDSANAMGCNFVRGVESVTVVLRGDARELTRTHSLLGGCALGPSQGSVSLGEQNACLFRAEPTAMPSDATATLSPTPPPRPTATPWGSLAPSPTPSPTPGPTVSRSRCGFQMGLLPGRTPSSRLASRPIRPGCGRRRA